MGRETATSIGRCREFNWEVQVCGLICVCRNSRSLAPSDRSSHQASTHNGSLSITHQDAGRSCCARQQHQQQTACFPHCSPPARAQTASACSCHTGRLPGSLCPYGCHGAGLPESAEQPGACRSRTTKTVDLGLTLLKLIKSHPACLQAFCDASTPNRQPNAPCGGVPVAHCDLLLSARPPLTKRTGARHSAA